AVIWMQLGVVNEETAKRARARGVTVVMNRCPKIEFRRLFDRPREVLGRGASCYSAPAAVIRRCHIDRRQPLPPPRVIALPSACPRSVDWDRGWAPGVSQS